MNIKEYLTYLKTLKKKPSAKDGGYTEALDKMRVRIKKRVHVDGKKPDENQIGKYSTKGWGYEKADFYKKSAFKPDKAGGKFQFIEAGYKGLREAQQMKADKVYLDYSGQMKKGLVAKNKKIKIEGSRNARVYQENAERFGEFYNPSIKELEAYKKDITAVIEKRILKGIRRKR